MVNAAASPFAPPTGPGSAPDGVPPVVGRPSPTPEPVVPEDRWYVFYPEGPEDFINIRGKEMRRFTFGRLVSDLDKLSNEDLFWLSEQMRSDGHTPKFIMWQGDPRDPSLAMGLMERVSRVCTEKADATDATKITEDVRYTLAGMLSLGTAEQGAGLDLNGQAKLYRDMARLQPHIMSDLGFKAAQEAEQHDAEDNAAIEAGLRAAGAAGTGDDPMPEGDPPEGPPQAPTSVLHRNE